MIWKNGEVSYSNQLETFQNLKKLVESKIDQVRSDQNSLLEQTKSHKVEFDSISIEDGKDDELHSALTELILEGLRWVNPKILERKEAGYVPA